MNIFTQCIGVLLFVLVGCNVFGQDQYINKEFVVDTTLNERVKQCGTWEKRLNDDRSRCETRLSKTKDTLKIKLLSGGGLTGSFVSIYINKYNKIPIVTYNTWTDYSDNGEYTTFAEISMFSIKLNKNPFKDGFVGLIGEVQVSNDKFFFELVVKPTEEDDIPLNIGKKEYFRGNVYNRDSIPIIGAFIFGFWKDDYCIQQENTDIEGVFQIRKDSIKYFKVIALNYETYTFSYDDVKDYNYSFRSINRSSLYYNVFLKKRRYNCPKLFITDTKFVIDSVLYKANFPKPPLRCNVRFSSIEDSCIDLSKSYSLAKPIIGYEMFYRHLYNHPQLQDMTKGDVIEILFNVSRTGIFTIESANGYKVSSKFLTYLSSLSSWTVAKNLHRTSISSYKMQIEKK